MKIFFFRHGETSWNKLKKFQGHTDIPLSQKGINEVSRWRIPDNIEHWFVSPLIRAQQTAQVHYLSPLTVVSALIEANWGLWEGKMLKELKRIDPKTVQRIADDGLDMRPPGGESPREVRRRLISWLSNLKGDYQRIGVISHRGVIRAALSHATGWDMKTPHAVNITHNHAYEFDCKATTLEYVAEHDLIPPVRPRIK